MNWKDIANRVAYLSVILILVFVVIFSGLRILESTVYYNGDTSGPVTSKTIVRDGVSYFPRQDITVVMVLGIDRFGIVRHSNSYNNRGAADMVSLLIFDETNEKCNILCLNRDTMLEMPVLGIGGKQAGTVYQQLALSHTYGSGLSDSCENTRKTVSDFLYGIEIDHYVAMNMDAIGLLNDAVGGVTVNVVDDFSEIDPTITKGKITLKGEQAIHFVRTRRGVADQTNISRMERQEQYMDGFLDAVRTKQAQSTDFVVSAYNDVKDYIVTDCSTTVLSGMMSRYVDYDVQDVVSPEGENVLGNTYFEFHVDEKKLDKLILDLFYAPKN